MDVNTSNGGHFFPSGSYSKFPLEVRGPSVESCTFGYSLSDYSQSRSLVSLGSGQLKQSVAVRKKWGL